MEVKRQAVTELQKAVAAAEAKASEILAIDRANMERTVEEVRKRTCDEVTALLNRQEDSNEVRRRRRRPLPVPACGACRSVF